MKHKIEKLINTDITLEKVHHEYTLKSNPGMSFYSCSDLVSDQFRPFEAEKIARFLVYKTRKYANYTVESLLAEWKAAKDEGSRVHEELDDYIRHGISVSATKAIPGMEWMDDMSSDFGDTVYSEVIVYSEELKLAGTIDMLIHNSSTNECILFDWKTSKKMDRSSSKKGITSACSDMDDCRFDKYSLQVSLYAYLLEKYHGIKIAGCYLLHLSHYDADTLKASNLRSNVVEMIQEYSRYNSSYNNYNQQYA